VLPIVPNTQYSLTLEVEIPPEAVDTSSGIYLGENRLAALPEGGAGREVSLRCDLPPQNSDHIILTLKTKGWVPAQTRPGNQDYRTLGVQVYSLSMKAKEAGTQVFNANTGEWMEH
jgi:hypothetical protein